jgi:hypothetical protein
MVQTPVRQITLAEFLELPDTKPASEYIDGEIIQKPMPHYSPSIQFSVMQVSDKLFQSYVALLVVERLSLMWLCLRRIISPMTRMRMQSTLLVLLLIGRSKYFHQNKVLPEFSRILITVWLMVAKWAG